MPRYWHPDPKDAPDDEPTLDTKALQAHRDQLFIAAGPHQLLHDGRVTAEDQQRMRGAILRHDDGVVAAVVEGLQTVGEADAQKTAALIADRQGQNKGVEKLAVAHEQLASIYWTTWLVRCDANWSRTQQGISYLRGRYEATLQSPNPDPRTIAAWTGVQAALKEQEEKQSKNQKAKESARKEGAGETQTLLQEVKELRQALANKDQVVAGLQRRLVELEQGVAPLPTHPGSVRSQPR